jgi:hypothetical protein
VGQQARQRAKSASEAGRRPAVKPKPKYRITRKTRLEHTRVADETEEEGDDDQDQVEDDEEEIEDHDDEEENEEPNGAQEDCDIRAEPTNLAYESRLYAVSRSDLDFDQDALYPCDSPWGAEGFRRSRDLPLREQIRMIKETSCSADNKSVKSSTRASLVAPVVDRSRVLP